MMRFSHIMSLLRDKEYLYLWNCLRDDFKSELRFRMDKILPRLLEWFFPYLKSARKFLYYALNRNGTKALYLSSSRLRFRCRTKDRDQFYYDFECSLFGKVTAYQTQYIENGKPVNLFMNVIIPVFLNPVSEDENEETDTDESEIETFAVTKKVFESRILTKRQFFRAVRQIRQLPMDWFKLAEGKQDEAE